MQKIIFQLRPVYIGVVSLGKYTKISFAYIH
jgi:hypothetical protein